MLHTLKVYFIFLWSFGATLASNQISYAQFPVLQSYNSEFTRGFQTLVQRIQMENYFVGYFLLRNHPADCVDEQLPLNFALPFMQLNASETIYVRGSGNSYLLAILCIDNLNDKELVLKFAKDLQHIRTRRVLAIHNRNLSASAQLDIKKFFRHCMEVKFLHAILLHRDFATTNVYHSFNQFPDFELEIRNLHSKSAIYPNRFKNVGGKKFRIMAVQFAPVIIVHKIGNKIHMEGYMGNFLKTFISKYNFRLWLPKVYELNINLMIAMPDIYQAARNDSIDVGACFSSPGNILSIHECTYPVEFFQWLTMLPVEPPLKAYYFFITIFSPTCLVGLCIIAYCVCVIFAIEVKLQCGNFRWNRTLLVLLINPWKLDLVRGFLSQSIEICLNSATRRTIFLLIFALGGAINSLFSTKMFDWLTLPPQAKLIEKFSDVAEHNLKILIPENNKRQILFYRGEQFWMEYSHIFKGMKTFEEYQQSINALDARYGYVMSTIMWPIIEERQMHFKRPVFRLSSELYYTKGALLSIPIGENSIYKDLLSDFSLRTRESGLINYWHKMTFYSMYSAKQFDLKDPIVSDRHEVLTLDEFKWLCMAYSAGMALSGLAFMLEWIWYILSTIKY